MTMKRHELFHHGHSSKDIIDEFVDPVCGMKTTDETKFIR